MSAQTNNKEVSEKMQLSNVSFGRVVTVSGNPKKIKNIDKKLAATGQVMMKDVTDYYQSAMPSGEMAQAARKGDKVKLYITGQERKSVENSEPGWRSINDILGHIQKYYDANKLSISEVVSNVLKIK